MPVGVVSGLRIRTVLDVGLPVRASSYEHSGGSLLDRFATVAAVEARRAWLEPVSSLQFLMAFPMASHPVVVCVHSPVSFPLQHFC